MCLSRLSTWIFCKREKSLSFPLFRTQHLSQIRTLSIWSEFISCFFRIIIRTTRFSTSSSIICYSKPMTHRDMSTNTLQSMYSRLLSTFGYFPGVGFYSPNDHPKVLFLSYSQDQTRHSAFQLKDSCSQLPYTGQNPESFQIDKRWEGPR